MRDFASMKFLSLLLLRDGFYSVDVSDNPYLGGYCRLFRNAWDAQEWAKTEFGLEIPDKAFEYVNNNPGKSWDNWKETNI